jgi:RNA polymerase sigma-70 factor (ECF subfamily)
MSRMEEALLANLQTFTAFARSRVGDPQLAEDVVQESLVKALAAANPPEDDENTVAWFYRILRRSIIDVYRRNAARSRALDRFQLELPEQATDEDETTLCQCFKRLLPAVPPSYRELLQRVDLDGEDASQVATSLGLTRNNLNVRLHRARGHLRDALSQNCKACAKNGCLDCTCGETSGEC